MPREMLNTWHISKGSDMPVEHIPFGVTGCFRDLDSYRILVAPVLTALEDKDNQRLIRYVENGYTVFKTRQLHIFDMYDIIL